MKSMFKVIKDGIKWIGCMFDKLVSKICDKWIALVEKISGEQELVEEITDEFIDKEQLVTPIDTEESNMALVEVSMVESLIRVKVTGEEERIIPIQNTQTAKIAFKGNPKYSETIVENCGWDGKLNIMGIVKGNIIDPNNVYQKINL